MNEKLKDLIMYHGKKKDKEFMEEGIKNLPEDIVSPEHEANVRLLKELKDFPFYPTQPNNKALEIYSKASLLTISPPTKIQSILIQPIGFIDLVHNEYAYRIWYSAKKQKAHQFFKDE